MAAVLFFIAAVWVTFNVRRWNSREVFQWDSDGYYLYLPATFIHGDLFGLEFLEEVPPNDFKGGYRFGQGASWYAPTGKYVDKYTMGTAVFELPFFLVAHGWCVLSGTDVADGYSPPYHLAMALASAFWAFMGLLVLARFLRRCVSDGVVAITLIAMGLGTNLFFYSSYAPGMSHPHLFFLCALVVERTDAWFAGPSMGRALAIGLCIGLATLTRPTAALFALIPLCWAIPSGGWVKWTKHGGQVLAAMVLGALCVLPQMVYWKIATGSFIHWSYGDEGFDFLHPHILDGLFSFRKGWFIYTPLALLAMAGIPFLLRRGGRNYAVMLACFFIPFLYVTFSWRMWWYGGSFGSRVMIDTLPLLAWPLAELVQWMSGAGRKWRNAFLGVMFVFLALNLFQQWQYQRGIIHYEAMDLDRWVEVFGRTTTEGLAPFP